MVWTAWFDEEQRLNLRNPTLKTRLLGMAATLAVILLVTALSPIEQTLGESIRIVYFHGAWVWAGLVSFGLAALAGLLGLVLRRGWPRWSLALGRTGLFFWLTYLPMSLLVMQLNWGGVFFDEPRFRIPLTFGIVGLLLQGGLAVMNTGWLTNLCNLVFGAALWWQLGGLENVLHPDSPIFTSDAVRIQVFFIILLRNRGRQEAWPEFSWWTMKSISAGVTAGNCRTSQAVPIFHVRKEEGTT